MNNKKYEDTLNKLSNIGRTFDINWKEHYSHYPEVNTLSYEERQKWQDFTWKVVNDLIGNLETDFMDVIDETRDVTIEEIKDAIDAMQYIYRCMDHRKQQLILQKIALQLKSLGWKILPEWEVQLRSEGNIPLTKQLSSDKNIDVNINLFLKDDMSGGIYPEYSVYSSFFITDVATHDIDTIQDVDITFTDENFHTDGLTNQSAQIINKQIDELINREYAKYSSQNPQIHTHP